MCIYREIAITIAIAIAIDIDIYRRGRWAPSGARSYDQNTYKASDHLCQGNGRATTVLGVSEPTL